MGGGPLDEGGQAVDRKNMGMTRQIGQNFAGWLTPVPKGEKNCIGLLGISVLCRVQGTFEV